MKDKIKTYYLAGLWTKKMVGDAVIKGKITEQKYEEITDEPYTG